MSMKAVRRSAQEKIAKEKEEDRQRVLARLANVEKKTGVDYFTKITEEHEVSRKEKALEQAVKKEEKAREQAERKAEKDKSEVMKVRGALVLNVVKRVDGQLPCVQKSNTTTVEGGASRERWRCDVCLVATFDSYDEACRHKNECRMEANLRSLLTKEQLDDISSLPNSNPLTGVTVVNKTDVLNGRGGAVNEHNTEYRSIINIFRESYRKTTFKCEKKRIAQRIVIAFRRVGGRFLQKDKSGHTWEDIGDEKAVEKVKQAFRQ